MPIVGTSYIGILFSLPTQFFVSAALFLFPSISWVRVSLMASFDLGRIGLKCYPVRCHAFPRLPFPKSFDDRHLVGVFEDMLRLCSYLRSSVEYAVEW